MIEMPWCPKYKMDYIQGIIKCPECGGLLEDSPVIEVQPVVKKHDVPVLDVLPDEKEWVVLCTVKSPDEAIMIRDVLQSNGIAGSVRDSMGAFRQLYGEFTFFDNDVEIYVNVNDVENAEKLIKEHVGWSEEELMEYMKSQGSLGDDDSDDEEYEDDEIE